VIAEHLVNYITEVFIKVIHSVFVVSISLKVSAVIKAIKYLKRGQAASALRSEPGMWSPCFCARNQTPTMCLARIV